MNTGVVIPNAENLVLRVAERANLSATPPEFKADRRTTLGLVIGRSVIWLLTRRWLQSFVRRFWPVPQVTGWAAVSHYDDVVEVLNRHDVFTVPFAKEISRLNDGADPGTLFILGTDEAGKHGPQLKRLMQAFRRADVAEHVVPICRDAAQSAVREAQRGEIDAVRDLIIGVPLELCRQYYGLRIVGCARDFVDATMVVSGHLFGKPPIEPNEYVDRAAAYVRWMVDYSINQEISPETRAPNDKTVLARMVRPDPESARLPREEIRAFLMGMIVGFVPTNTLAGGHILQMLLDHRSFMDEASIAARAGDDDLLTHCLFEALRFKPHNPGPFRRCTKDLEVASGTPRAKVIKKDTHVLAWTMSAMFDPAQIDDPGDFKPGRPASNNLVLGHGLHWCAGAYIARAQLAQTFKPLLCCRGLKRNGRMKQFLAFPDSLSVVFEPVKATQGKP